jgi:hypothetical protein
VAKIRCNVYFVCVGVNECFCVPGSENECFCVPGSVREYVCVRESERERESV